MIVLECSFLSFFFDTAECSFLLLNVLRRLLRGLELMTLHEIVLPFLYERIHLQRDKRKREVLR